MFMSYTDVTGVKHFLVRYSIRSLRVKKAVYRIGVQISVIVEISTGMSLEA